MAGPGLRTRRVQRQEPAYSLGIRLTFISVTVPRMGFIRFVVLTALVTTVSVATSGCAAEDPASHGVRTAAAGARRRRRPRAGHDSAGRQQADADRDQRHRHRRAVLERRHPLPDHRAAREGQLHRRRRCAAGAGAVHAGSPAARTGAARGAGQPRTRYRRGRRTRR